MLSNTVQLFPDRSSDAGDANNEPSWDEQDELDYIENGEPLQQQHGSHRFAMIAARGRYKTLPVVLAFPFLVIVWVFHPLHEFVTQAFENLDADQVE